MSQGFLRQHRREMLLFIVPAAVLFIAVMLVPIGVNAFYAFTDWSGLGSAYNFVGLQNFHRMLGDAALGRAVVNTLVFTVLNAPLQIATGLILALGLVKVSRLSGVLRMTIILPIAISGVVLGFLGSLIFDPRSGILVALAELPGLGWLEQNWLGDPQLAMGAVVVMNVWQWSGFTMLIFIAGLAAQPAELHEAARIDGASSWQRFAHVTWPLLAPAVTINTILTVIGCLKIFDIVYVLTKGGPAGATETIVARIALSTTIGDFGYSAATNLVLTLGVIAVSIVLMGVLRRKEMAA